MGIAIDTLAYARRLRDAGFSEQQAEAQAEALAAAMTDTLATKQDLRELETRTSSEFAAVRHEMAAGFAALRHEMRELETRMRAHTDTSLADLERRMTMRLGGIMVAGISVVSVLVKIL